MKAKTVPQDIHKYEKTQESIAIYFTREDDRIILLLLGGDKSHQAKDIAKARVFRDDYRRRRKHG